MKEISLQRAVDLATAITRSSRGYTRDELVKAIGLILSGIEKSDVTRGNKHSVRQEIWE
jgi:hypothetical protein